MVSAITLTATFPALTAVTTDDFSVKWAITADDTTWDTWVASVVADTSANDTDKAAITLIDGFLLQIEFTPTGEYGVVMRSNPPDSNSYNYGAIVLV